MIKKNAPETARFYCLILKLFTFNSFIIYKFWVYLLNDKKERRVTLFLEKKSFKDTGLRLIKKGQKGIVHAIFSRFGVIILLFALQIILFFAGLIWFQSFASELYFGGLLIGLFVSAYILNTKSDPSAKLTWVILVMALPVFGTLLYAYTELEVGHRSLRNKVAKIAEETKEKIPQEKAVFKAFEEKELKDRLLRGLIIIGLAIILSVAGNNNIPYKLAYESAVPVTQLWVESMDNIKAFVEFVKNIINSTK